MRIAGENQLAFKLAVFLSTRYGIRNRKIRRVADDFLLYLVGFVDVLKFQIQHGIDPMLAQQRPHPVFPAPSGKNAAIARGTLAFDIQLSGPAPQHSIFKLGVRTEESMLALSRHTYRR